MLSNLAASSIIFTNSMAGKAYMTFGFRAGGQDSGPAFERAHKAQLNEAEWSPILIAGLILLESKGQATPIAAALAAGGSVLYLWAKCAGLLQISPIGALARYFAGFMMAGQLLTLLK
ncbi:hypothetical protein AB1Y20_019541 [Prymnesium parvum]|uniref:Glutathione transferase n=1 Tax=Prymnesium parvum TaxID=97485 RepID=A0AB34JRC4_PRYPA|mmetsp:Transcript_40290/g.99874  ORF Transcript_40290/g.99874 Transcript_40290/m.99874 type:complete len:118 (-) Transcript_40290:411-764(-)